MGEMLAILSAFFYGASNIYVNRGIIEEKINRYEGLFLSLVVNNMLNIIILPFYIFFTAKLPSFDSLGIMFYVLAGVLTSFLARILLFACIERIKASRASVLKITAPVFTVIIGTTILDEKLHLFELTGIAIVLAGVLVVSFDSRSLVKENGVQAGLKQVSGSLDSSTLKLGLVLGILAGISLGGGNVFRKLGTDFYGSPFIGVIIGAAVSLILISILSKFSDKMNVTRVFKRENLSFSYIVVGIWYSLATYSIFAALDLAPVSLVNSLASIQPLSALILSAIILRKHDVITMQLIIGSLVVIAGCSMIFLY